MLRVLIDTCVWLDLAKDHRQQPVIGALEELVGTGEVALLVPQVVIDEFTRNKDRVIAETQKSLSSHFRIVCDAVEQFAGEDRTQTLQALREVDHKIATSGDAVSEAVERIDALLRSVQPIRTTSAIKARVADRAIARLAPYHRSKNSIGDAILVETYAKIVKSENDSGVHYAFVTHNIRDFSSDKGDQRLPHPDLTALFNGSSSVYCTSMRDLLHGLNPELLSDQEEEHNLTWEPRRFAEIMEAEDRLGQQIWYDRHSMRVNMIAEGKIKVLPEQEYSRSPYRHDEILDTIWTGALKAAEEVEREIGNDNLGPWSDFEWGMLNGKLSALRWMLGCEWDMLDT